jgi:hypothetical protein
VELKAELGLINLFSSRLNIERSIPVRINYWEIVIELVCPD